MLQRKLTTLTRYGAGVAAVLVTALAGADRAMAQTPAAMTPQQRLDKAAESMRDIPRLKSMTHDRRKALVEFVTGNTLFVMMHELGHAVISVESMSMDTTRTSSSLRSAGTDAQSTRRSAATCATPSCVAGSASRHAFVGPSAAMRSIACERDASMSARASFPVASRPCTTSHPRAAASARGVVMCGAWRADAAAVRRPLSGR